MMTTRAKPPLIVEVSINGLITKDENPHVPISAAEMSASCIKCFEAGATIIHAHAGEPYVGEVRRHASAPYVAAFGPVTRRFAGAVLYPTLPAGPGLPIEQRYAHIEELADAGLLRVAPIDVGTLNWGRIAPDRSTRENLIYVNTFAEVAYVFEFCRKRRLGCTIGIFEPGFLQLVLAHARMGTLPEGSVLKFEFSTGRKLMFGLPPTAVGLDAYLSMLGDLELPWIVNLRDGDLMDGFGRLALERGGHVRVGIEDYGGPRRPRNEELVADIVALGRSLGRPPATMAELPGLLRLPSA